MLTDVGERAYHPRLFRHSLLFCVRNVLCPRTLKDGLGAIPHGTIFGMDGNQDVAFLDFPFVLLRLIFRGMPNPMSAPVRPPSAAPAAAPLLRAAMIGPAAINGPKPGIA